ncbi:MAG: hypothetical protein NTU95_09530 [Methanothrix sp.]|nr:hypothetical protein [Methanothrix sp.]
MIEKIKFRSILVAGIFIIHLMSSAPAMSSPPALSIDITSSKTLNGTAGDYVTVDGTITNTGEKPHQDIVTYLSLVDNETKLPVDLEDWSAEKGLHIGTIEAGQTLPLNWKIHFVKSGAYSLIIVAEAAGNELPQVSSIIQFHVNPKINLNPGEVLPVALGTPIILSFVLILLAHKRRLEE